MKKIATILTTIILASASANAMACPKGTTLVGGTGSNHKGGKCVKKADTKKKADKKSKQTADKPAKKAASSQNHNHNH